VVLKKVLRTVHNNTLEIFFNIDLFDIHIDLKNENAYVIKLNCAIRNWLTDCNFKMIYNPNSSPYELWPGHGELVFENNQDMSAFILRWM